MHVEERKLNVKLMGVSNSPFHAVGGTGVGGFPTPSARIYAFHLLNPYGFQGICRRQQVSIEMPLASTSFSRPTDSHKSLDKITFARPMFSGDISIVVASRPPPPKREGGYPRWRRNPLKSVQPQAMLTCIAFSHEFCVENLKKPSWLPCHVSYIQLALSVKQGRAFMDRREGRTLQGDQTLPFTGMCFPSSCR